MSQERTDSIIQLPVGGEQWDVKEVPFDVVKEDWSEYTLPDGSRVRLKTIVGKIYIRVDAQGQPMQNEVGDPFVSVAHNIQILASR